MSSAAIGQVKRSLNRALAFTLLVENTPTLITGIFRLFQLRNAMGQVLKALSPDFLDTLTEDQMEVIMTSLQRIHQPLAAIWRTGEANRNDLLARINHIPILGSVLADLQDQTEDIGDRIESLALRTNREFKALVSSCASALGIENPGDTIARMHR